MLELLVDFIQQPLDAGGQPHADGQMPYADRRSDLGQRDPRPTVAQRLPNRTKGLIDEQDSKKLTKGGTSD